MKNLPTGTAKDDMQSSDLDAGGRLPPMQVPPTKKVPKRKDAWANGADRMLDIYGEIPVARVVDLQPLGNRQEPGHDDPFLEDELIIALALARATTAKADKILPLFDKVLDDPAGFDENAFDEVTKEAEDEWQDAFLPAAVVVTAAILSAINKGERNISAGILRGSTGKKSVFDNMVAISKFRTNQFFNDQIMPALQKQIGFALDNAPAMGQPDLTTIRDILNRRLKSVPYWRVVANAAASRSYHYGYLKAAQAQGYRGFRFVAVIDPVTSEICTYMDGREWFIADAVNLMERTAATDNIDEVKSIMPWPKFADIRDLENDALRDLGVLVPPLHGNCRSTIVPV